MRVKLIMSKGGGPLGQGITFFEAHATYDIPEDVLRREGLVFLQKLATLHEAKVADNAE